MRRLGIFVFYEKDGIVDRFVEYFLKEFIRIIDELFIICNGELNCEGKKIFKSFTSNLILRNNEDYDFGAIRDILLNYLDKKYLCTFDELVLCNSTFFGPLYPLDNVFKEMQNKDIDFWGLTRHGKTANLPAHLQSYFLVIRNQLLRTDDFYFYWKSRKTHLTTVEEVIDNFEGTFTNYFSKKGYKWEAYSVAKEFESEGQPNFNHYINIPYILATEHKMPVIKIKTLLNKDIVGMSNEDIPLLFQYIKENTFYDLDLILQYLIRTTDISILKNMLSLDYVLSEKEDVDHSNFSLAVFVNAHNDYFLKRCLEHLSQVTAPVYLAVDNNLDSAYLKKYFNLKNNYKVIHIDNNRGAFDTLKYLAKEYFCNYEYFCFLSEDISLTHKYEKKLSETSKIENILGGQRYLQNVCNLFRENQRLGFLFSPNLPYLSEYGVNYQNWMKNRTFIRDLSIHFKLDIEIDAGAKSFSDINAFWGRTSLINCLFLEEFKTDILNSSKELDSIIGKLLIYLGKREGYYSGSLYNKTYLPNYIENMSNIVLNMQQNALESNIKRHYDMVDFAKKYRLLYLYGAGKVSHSIKDVLKKEGIDIKGMIVSDMQFDKNRERNPKDHIISFSQAEKIKDTIGVIIALNYKNSLEIVPCLKDKGFRDVFCLHAMN